MIVDIIGTDSTTTIDEGILETDTFFDIHEFQATQEFQTSGTISINDPTATNKYLADQALSLVS